MPIGIQRLNQRHQHPTPHIVFIKPLSGPAEKVAHEFLSRVAAICHPIVRDNHLSVTTLEEFPHNNEFIGRNFNAGECIQLVLKFRTGAWLPFRSVVMVMMHELAHNAQMNHSKAFWKVRNEYATQMKFLWQKGYTGEGVWGPGRNLFSGEIIDGGGAFPDGDMPEHLCGGTYRSRRRKRRRLEKDGQELTWKDKQERRIAKKFGVNGVSLGDDEAERRYLEKGKVTAAKPKVAGSKRGRELRAAAALARFGQEKSAPVKHDDVEGQGEELDHEYEEMDVKGEDAVNFDGTKMRDEHGQGLVKICEDEDADDASVKKEMQELQEIASVPLDKAAPLERKDRSDIVTPSFGFQPSMRIRKGIAGTGIAIAEVLEPSSEPRGKPNALAEEPDERPKMECPACSTINQHGVALLCVTCSCVLDARKSPGAWSCQAETCRDGSYLNSADFGVCGVCSTKRTGRST